MTITGINKHYGNFPILARTPILGFFLQTVRIVEINKHVQYVRSQPTIDTDLILVDLKLKVDIFHKGRQRSFLTIALCLVCVVVNFYPLVFVAIAAVSLTLSLPAELTSRRLKKVILASSTS